MAAALFAGRPALWLFVLLAWLGGMGTAFFTPALTALTVEIASSEQLANADALYGLAGSASRIAGPALGGILVASVLGTGVVFGIGAVYGLLSSAAVLAVPDVRAVRWRDRSPERTETAQAPG